MAEVASGHRDTSLGLAVRAARAPRARRDCGADLDEQALPAMVSAQPEDDVEQEVVDPPAHPT